MVAPTVTFIERYAELASQGTQFVAVTVVQASGSTPQDAGSKMIVTSTGLDYGTVGGGRIEARAIEEAQKLLANGARTQFFDWNLKADIGMTCGGRVKVFMESVGVVTWKVVIFGAGHVSQALAQILLPMPCSVTCVDPRKDWLDRLPDRIKAVQLQNPPDFVDQLTDDSYVLCMTQGHASDMPVLLRIFQTGRQFPMLGVIGSKAKGAVLRKEIIAGGILPEQIDFHCPVGLPVGSNHPAEIAVSIAAQLLKVRDMNQIE